MKDKYEKMAAPKKERVKKEPKEPKEPKKPKKEGEDIKKFISSDKTTPAKKRKNKEYDSSESEFEDENVCHFTLYNFNLILIFRISQHLMMLMMMMISWSKKSSPRRTELQLE